MHEKKYMVAELEPMPSKVIMAQKSTGEARGACSMTAWVLTFAHMDPCASLLWHFLEFHTHRSKESDTKSEGVPPPDTTISLWKGCVSGYFLIILVIELNSNNGVEISNYKCRFFPFSPQFY